MKSIHFNNYFLSRMYSKEDLFPQSKQENLMIMPIFLSLAMGILVTSTISGALGMAGGMILMGLAVMGGGVATTAGGVKLLRVWALYLNGLREMERLVHPSAVKPLNRSGARIQKNGAFLAWVAFMLFALSLAALTIGFAATGVVFEDALILAISGLTTTGPLIEAASDDALQLVQLSPAGKLLYALAMVVGRMETLALVALFAPDLWRN